MESLEDRRLLAGDFEDVVIGVGNLPRRNTEIEAQIIINEQEQDGDSSNDAVTNNTIETAQKLNLGFGFGEYQAIDILGELAGPPLASFFPPQDSKEAAPLDPNNPLTAIQRDDGSFALANAASSNGISRFQGFIGDSPLGYNDQDPFALFGDGDYYELANIEAGQYITAHVQDSGSRIPGTTGTGLILYDEFGRVLQSSESNPSISNFISYRVPTDGTYYFAVVPFFDVSAFSLPNNPFDPSQVHGGPSDSYVITTSVDDSADIDFYSVDLMPGDILGLNALGSASTISLRNSEGDLILQSSDDRSDLYPLASPLPGGGNSSLAYVISQPGTYYIGVQAHQSYDRYILESRVFRPAIESEPVGSEQILFLDFDGATFNPQVTFGPNFRSELAPLSQFMPAWQLSNEAELIDKVVAEVKRDFDDLKAINPDMRLTILNSKDHADPFGQPNVSRVIIGGTEAQLQIPGIFGIAESIDVGNFDTTETGVVLLNTLSGTRFDSNSLNHYPIAPGAKKVDLVARGISRIVSHEAAHHFGAWHTENMSEEANIIDSGGTFTRSIGIGPDLIWGTADDTDPKFVDDIFSLREGYVGVENVPGMFASVFVAGKGGTTPGIPSATGSVFGDSNGDGMLNEAEGGLAGIRVYLDSNGDNEFGISEPTAITDRDGNFSLDVPTTDDDVEIRVATMAGQTVTSPASGGITLAQIREGFPVEFGVESLTGDASGTDFGHAPLTYGSASHTIQGGVRLGTSVTGDDASGEDTNDDGVSLSGLRAGGTATATIAAVAEGFAPGIVSGWIDFNDNGRFESSERVISNRQINGTESITFNVPASARVGETWARFRLGYTRDIGPGGASGVGEVEDYVITIAAPGGGDSGGGGGGGGDTTAPQANPDVIEVSAGASDVSLNVLANDSAGTEAVMIQQVSASTVGSTIRVSDDGLRILYTPAPGITRETFSYSIGNSIDTSTSTVTVNIGGAVDPGGDLVAVRLETTSTTGVPLTSVTVGQNFNVSVYVDDLRAPALRRGVWAAYMDVEFDESLASVDGDFVFGSYFDEGQNPPGGDISNILDDDFGAHGLDPPTETTNQLLMTIPMVANQAGVLNITTNGADNLPLRLTLLYSEEVAVDRIDFGSASLVISEPTVVATSPFTNPVNRFDVDNDGYVVPRDALYLITDINENGARQLNPLIGAVSGPYLDVTGDGFLSPRDARDLINEINRLAALQSVASEPDDSGVAAAVDAALNSSSDGDEEEFFDIF